MCVLVIVLDLGGHGVDQEYALLYPSLGTQAFHEREIIVRGRFRSGIAPAQLFHAIYNYARMLVEGLGSEANCTLPRQRQGLGGSFRRAIYQYVCIYYSHLLSNVASTVDNIHVVCIEVSCIYMNVYRGSSVLQSNLTSVMYVFMFVEVCVCITCEIPEP